MLNAHYAMLDEQCGKWVVGGQATACPYGGGSDQEDGEGFFADAGVGSKFLNGDKG